MTGNQTEAGKKSLIESLIQLNLSNCYCKSAYMNTANEHGATKQIQIGFGENAFNFIHIFVCKPKLFERSQCMLHMQDKPKFANANRCVSEGQRQFCCV